MAGFGRSNSLSINTGASLFGSSSNARPQVGGGIFNTSQQSQPPQAGGLFGSAQQSQPQQAGGLFGSTQQSQSQQAGGLFGTSQSQPQQQQSGGLFGASQSQPQQGGGLFGSTPQPQAQQAGGLFAPAASTAQPQHTGGLLGGLGLGQSTAQPQQTGGFGLLGGLSLGQNNQQQQQTVPGVRIDLSNVRGNTRFSDLHEDLQKEIQAIDDFIQKQISFKETIDESMFKNDENIRTLAPDVNLLAGKADTVELALDNDAQAIKGVRELVQQDAEDAKLSFRAIENLKLPPQFHYQNGWRQSMSAAHAADDDAPTPPDLVGYFSNRSDALDAQLRRCTEQVAEIEAHLQTIEASTMAETEALMMRRGGAGQSGDSGVQGKVRELARTMKLFEEAIMKVATRVGGTREEVVELVVGNGLGGANGGNGNGSGGGFGSPWASRSQIGTPVSRDRRAGWS